MKLEKPRPIPTDKYPNCIGRFFSYWQHCGHCPDYDNCGQAWSDRMGQDHRQGTHANNWREESPSDHNARRIVED